MLHLLLLSLVSYCSLHAQGSMDFQQLGPMQFRWEYHGSLISFEVISPEDGWLLLGINGQDDILGASLFMGGLVSEQSFFSERFVTGFGEHQSFEELGWSSSAKLILVEPLTTGGERLRFTLPIKGKARHEYDLSSGQYIWLILAYSVSDDIGHHSRFRRHVRVKL